MQGWVRGWVRRCSGVGLGEGLGVGLGAGSRHNLVQRCRRLKGLNEGFEQVVKKSTR